MSERGHRIHKAGGRRDADQAGNDARRGAEHGRLAAREPIVTRPGERAGGGREVRRRRRRSTSSLSDSQLAAGVEAEPTDPQHGGAQRRVGQVVRPHVFVAEAKSLADDTARRSARKRRS